MTIRIGIVGAGNRGEGHASEYAGIGGVEVAAVADVDREAATALASEHGAAVFEDFREMFADAELDAVSVCVHNNLHRPVAVAAAEAGRHVFCEKPLAATYADARAITDACADAGVELGVQNGTLFTPETRATRALIDDGRLGEPYYARGVYSRRRGRPYVDGYGTPAFVSKESAGGGPVIDIGTYVLGQLLYLLGNGSVERVGGTTFEHTDAAYDEALVGEDAPYRERLAKSGYDVEDAGIGYAHLADGSLLSLRAAWHMFLPDESNVVAGSQGGVQLDPFEFYTTAADYEATVSLDLEEFERRQNLLASETGYEFGEDGENQFVHWIDTLRGDLEEPIPTGELATESMLIMDGIYRAEEAGRELSAGEVAERSESTAVELSELRT